MILNTYHIPYKEIDNIILVGRPNLRQIDKRVTNSVKSVKSDGKITEDA